jgi:hypothetical protein
VIYLSERPTSKFGIKMAEYIFDKEVRVLVRERDDIY